MSEYEDAENILSLYSRQTESEISELNRTVVALRSKISMLSDELSFEKDRIKNLPVPPTVISQIADLNSENSKLRMSVKQLGEAMMSYKQDAAAEIKRIQQQRATISPVVVAEIANYKTTITKLNDTISQYEKVPVSPQLMRDIADMKTLIAENAAEIEYYKSHAQQSVIINKEKVKPSRIGGLGRNENDTT